MYDIAKLARTKGIKNLFHTNGAMSPEPLRALLKYTDGVTVDLKAFDKKFYRKISSAKLMPVLKTLKIIIEEGVHLEIVNLIIPTLNDELDKIKEMCNWIRDNLGKDVPLRFTQIPRMPRSVNGDEWRFRIGFRKLPVFREAVKPRLVGGDRSHAATFFTAYTVPSSATIW